MKQWRGIRQRRKTVNRWDVLAQLVHVFAVWNLKVESAVLFNTLVVGFFRDGECVEEVNVVLSRN